MLRLWKGALTCSSGARRLAALEKEVELLRSAAPSAPAPPAPAELEAERRTEAKVCESSSQLSSPPSSHAQRVQWAGLLESLQAEWALERSRLQREVEAQRSSAEAEHAAAEAAAARATNERKRVLEMVEGRVGCVPHACAATPRSPSDAAPCSI
jgi:hypothetical protein